MEIILALALGTALLILHHYLKRVDSLHKATSLAFAPIDAQLQAGRNLIFKEMEIVKSIAPEEKIIYERVAKACGVAAGMKTIEEKIVSNIAVNDAIMKFHSVTERYPQLNDMQAYKAIQEGLYKVDRIIATARNSYNATVKEYNAVLSTFPTNVLGRISGYRKEIEFEPDIPPTAVKINDYGQKGIPAPLRIYSDGSTEH